MFEMYFPKPIQSVNIIQLNASSIQANFYIYGKIEFQQIIPIYSWDSPKTKDQDPDRQLAEEQWNNLI